MRTGARSLYKASHAQSFYVWPLWRMIYFLLQIRVVRCSGACQYSDGQVGCYFWELRLAVGPLRAVN